MMANVRAERLLKIPAEPSPELRIPGAAAQTRVVSMAGIRLGSWESARARLVSPAQASLPRSWPTPELRIPNAAAQTRIVSKARIRLDSRKSVRSFKGIICVDISEFESYMPSHAVRSPSAKMRVVPTLPIHWRVVECLGGLEAMAIIPVALPLQRSRAVRLSWRAKQIGHPVPGHWW